jgi:hypothetical protein
MVKTRFLAGVTTVLVLVSPAFGAEHYSCPSSIPSRDVEVKAIPGWKARVDRDLHLYGAGMSAGPPARMAVLRGEDRGKQTTRFGLEGHAGFEDGKWLDCYYGQGGEVQMSRRLDDGVQRCDITELKRVRSDQARLSITCK